MLAYGTQGCNLKTPGTCQINVPIILSIFYHAYLHSGVQFGFNQLLDGLKTG